MIKLKVENYCQNCNDFEPDVYKSKKYGGDTTTIVSCEYEKRCYNIYKHLKNLMIEKGKN